MGDQALRAQIAVRANRHPVGRLVIERVAVVKKNAELEMKAARVGARPSGHPAERTHPGDMLDRLDAEADMLALDLFGDRLVVEPTAAVADDLVPIFDKGAGELRVAFSRLATADRQTLTPYRRNRRNRRQPPTREPYSKTDSTIGLRTPGNDGMPISLRTPSETPSPSISERSPPPSKLRLMLTAIRAPPGHCGSGGLGP